MPPKRIRHPTQTKLKARIINYVTVNESHVFGTSVVTYDLPVASARELRLRVPAAFENVQITGTNITVCGRQGEEWSLKLPEISSEDCKLTVRWELPWKNLRNPLVLTGIKTVGVQQSGIIALACNDSLGISAQISGGQILYPDARELMIRARKIVASMPAEQLHPAIKLQYAKLNTIVIARVPVSEMTVGEMLEYLSTESQHIDKNLTGGSGIKVIIGGGLDLELLEKRLSKDSVDKDLRNITLLDAFQWITERAGLKFAVEPKAVVVMPRDVILSGHHPTYRFTIRRNAFAPLFIRSSMSADETIRKFFEDAGIPFQSGSALSYTPPDLFVTASGDNLARIRTILSTLRMSQPSEPFVSAMAIHELLVSRGWKSPSDLPDTLLAVHEKEEIERKKKQIERKLDTIVLPTYEPNNQTILEAIQCLNAASRKFDKMHTGVNFLPSTGLDAPHGESQKITFNVGKVSLRDALRFSCDSSGVSYRVEPNAVVIFTDIQKKPGPFSKHSYRVPAKFLKKALRTSRPQASHVKRFFEDTGFPFTAGTSVEYDSKQERLTVVSEEWAIFLVEYKLAELIRTSEADDPREISAASPLGWLGRQPEARVLTYSYPYSGWRLKLTHRK